MWISPFPPGTSDDFKTGWGSHVEGPKKRSLNKVVEVKRSRVPISTEMTVVDSQLHRFQGRKKLEELVKMTEDETHIFLGITRSRKRHCPWTALTMWHDTLIRNTDKLTESQT